QPISSDITPSSAGPVLFISHPQSITLSGDTGVGGTLPNATIQLMVGYPGTQHLYVQATHSGFALQGVSASELNPQNSVMSSGTVTINTYSAAVMGAGVYTDTLSISVCKDVACNEQIEGSPYVIPITYTVTGNVTPIA